MKAWMGVVVVMATLAVGIVLMRPGKPAPGPARGASAGAGAGSRATDEKIAFISRGERVEIAEHLKDGRWTIVEFTADW